MWNLLLRVLGLSFKFLTPKWKLIICLWFLSFKVIIANEDLQAQHRMVAWNEIHCNARMVDKQIKGHSSNNWARKHSRHMNHLCPHLLCAIRDHRMVQAVQGTKVSWQKAQGVREKQMETVMSRELAVHKAQLWGLSVSYPIYSSGVNIMDQIHSATAQARFKSPLCF